MIEETQKQKRKTKRKSPTTTRKRKISQRAANKTNSQHKENILHINRQHMFFATDESATHCSVCSELASVAKSFDNPAKNIRNAPV